MIPPPPYENTTTTKRLKCMRAFQPFYSLFPFTIALAYKIIKADAHKDR